MRPQIGLTRCNTTAECVGHIERLLAMQGCDAIIFEADGIGGQQFEMEIANGRFHALADVSLAELADDLLGGMQPAGKNRLTAASLHGTPQVVCLGDLDRVRRLQPSASDSGWIRTTPADCDRLGKDIAQKLSAARGPVRVLSPTGGLSSMDRPEAAFWNPQANRILWQSLSNWAGPQVKMTEIDAHINDELFASAVVAEIRSLIRATP